MTDRHRVRSRSLPWLVGLAGTVLAGAIGYGIAHLQGSQRVDDAQRAAQEQKLTLQDELAAAQSELRASQRRAHLLEANRQLHGVLLELDEHNFGAAQRALTSAAQVIARADPEATALVGAIRQTRLAVAEDVSGQRRTVLALVRALDEHLGLPQFVALQELDPQPPDGADSNPATPVPALRPPQELNLRPPDSAGSDPAAVP